MHERAVNNCPDCGKPHTGWPALAFISPDNYDMLPADDKAGIAELDTDFCTVRHPGQTDRFIRVTLSQRVNDHCEDLDYGPWVSLSEKSFQDYAGNFNNPAHETQYFGWLCNRIPEYELDRAIPMTVCTQRGNRRPQIFPHEDFDHPFVRDFYNGISHAEAERRINGMLRADTGSAIVPPRKKPWWKVW